jgi:hypothetical protein
LAKTARLTTVIVPQSLSWMAPPVIAATVPSRYIDGAVWLERLGRSPASRLRLEPALQRQSNKQI